MTRRPLRLLTLGPSALDPDLPRWLARELRAELPLEPSLAPPLPLQDAWRDPAAGQLRSNQVVDALMERYPPADTDLAEGAWTLALADADLGVPERDFVFGEATLGGHWALVGLARLAGDGLALLRLRALKEALHELGHLAGLRHCPDPRCVMARSRTVAEVDAKLAAYCGDCRVNFGVDPSRTHG